MVENREPRGMGQRHARQQVEEGVHSYHAQKHPEAMKLWRLALKKLKNPHERFICLGYLAQAHGETGNYREMLAHSLQQMDLANLHNDGYMRAEAYLNLARSNERLAEYHKAISYAKHCLENESEDPRTPGYAYLCQGSAYLGFSNFPRALESFELAMQVANKAQDRILELQICIGLGCLFTQIKDMNKADMFLNNARKLLETVRISDVYAKYQSMIQYHLSAVHLYQGNSDTAKALCEASLKSAAENGNKPIQGRCLIRMGDICREANDSEGCWSKYESGYQVMQEMEDRYGEMIALAGMAKSAAKTLKSNQTPHCECHAIELNQKCLDIALAINCKLGQLKCHLRLQQLYSSLSDEDSEERSAQAVTHLVSEMQTFCNFCGQRYGLKHHSLQALPCSHIFHESCLKQYVSNTDRAALQCPKCLKLEHEASTSISPQSIAEV